MVERAEPEVVGGHLGAAVGVPGVVVDGVLEGRGVRRLAGVVVEVTGAASSTRRTASRSGRRVAASTSPIVRSSRNGGSWPSSTRSPGRRAPRWSPETLAVAGRRPATARSSVDLPVPFSPDQADPPARLGDEVDAGEGGGVAEGDGEVADDDGLEGRHA